MKWLSHLRIDFTGDGKQPKENICKMGERFNNVVRIVIAIYYAIRLEKHMPGLKKKSVKGYIPQSSEQY